MVVNAGRSASSLVGLAVASGWLIVGCAVTPAIDTDAADAVAHPPTHTTQRPTPPSESTQSPPPEDVASPIPTEAKDSGSEAPAEESSASQDPDEAADMDEHAATPPLARVLSDHPERIVLNFDNADLHKVINTFADILGLNYLIDPKVKGTVNLHTKGEISKRDLFEILHDVVEINGAAMVKIGSIHHVVPLADTKSIGLSISRHEDASRRSDLVRPRLATHFVPLQYIAASEIEKVIKHFLTPGAHLSSYEQSRLLIFTESAEHLDTVLSIIRLFDTNIFEQITVRLFHVKAVDVTEVVQELEKIIAAFELPSTSGRGVGINMVPIPRTNAFLAISTVPESFILVEHWLNQLDKQTGRTDVQTYIYHVKNGIAGELADILNSIFTPSQRDQGQPQPAALRTTPHPATESSGGKPEITGTVRIIPYETTNTLIIKANPRDFEVVQGVLEALDIIPRQVLIEVMIAEVTLTESTEFGIEYSFLDGAGGEPVRLSGRTTDPDAPLAAKFMKIPTGTQADLFAELRARADESHVRILASPHLMVTDGKEASIEIGDEISIRTAISEGPGVVAGSAEATARKDTGTILKITPIINTTGLVTIDLDLEKSSVGAILEGSTDISIAQRRATTSMVVQDGETILIGGLIDETINQSVSKVPLLGDIPYLGFLFSKTTENTTRIELILLITPRVIRDLPEASIVTDQFMEKVQAIQAIMKEEGA